jgi:hypothetical protein
MLLVSANLIQLFDASNLPCGWIRWAWMAEDGYLVACAMVVMPEPELQLITVANADSTLFALHLVDNKPVLLSQLLRSKQDYHQARLHLLRASAEELQLLYPPFETLTALQQTLMADPAAPARVPLEPHGLLWFWDRYLKSFATPADTSDWVETTIATMEPANWDESVLEWKRLTTPGDDNLTASKVLCTCFNGHPIMYNHLYAHVLRVNDLLRAVLQDQVALVSSTWLPSLMCPAAGCSQQLNPSYITRKCILQSLDLPPVAETAYLLRSLKQKWNL